MIIKIKNEDLRPIEKGDLVSHNHSPKSSDNYGLALTSEINGSVLVRWLNLKYGQTTAAQLQPKKYYASLLSVVAKGGQPGDKHE